MASLEGPSKYLNNLLLARGLLPEGKMIDFAHPDHATDGVNATMTKVINLIHDLILRRDRESEQHEAMAATIRNLRAADTQRVLDFERMQDKNQHLNNEVATATAQNRTIQTNVKKLEGQIRELKEQNLKMKSTLDQVRAKCVADVRKRDVQIEKLKGHLTNIQRGKTAAGSMKINTINPQSSLVGKERRGGQDVNSADWSLEKETNGFLAALVNETSAENVSLRQIVSRSVESLKCMTGMPPVEPMTEEEDDDGIGIPGQYRKSRQIQSDTLIPVDVLANQMAVLLESCTSLLRDPSFVSIEEVQIRDEEIEKLRLGWEKMADRWQEAVTMMRQWKQKMTDGGREAEAEDFSDLSFGRSVALRPDGQPIMDSVGDLSSIDEESKVEDAPELALIQHTPKGESGIVTTQDVSLKGLVSSPAKRGIKLKQQKSALGEISGNSRVRTFLHDSSSTFKDDDNSLKIPDGTSPITLYSTPTEVCTPVSPSDLRSDEVEKPEAEEERSQRTNRKRKALPGSRDAGKTSRPRGAPRPQGPVGLTRVK